MTIQINENYLSSKPIKKDPLKILQQWWRNIQKERKFLIANIQNDQCKLTSYQINDFVKEGILKWRIVDEYTGHLISCHFEKEQGLMLTSIDHQNKLNWKCIIEKSEEGNLSSRIMTISSTHLAVQISHLHSYRLPKRDLIVIDKILGKLLFKINLNSSPNHEIRLYSQQVLWILGTPKEGCQFKLFSLSGEQLGNTIKTHLRLGEDFTFKENSLLLEKNEKYQEILAEGTEQKELFLLISKQYSGLIHKSYKGFLFFGHKYSSTILYLNFNDNEIRTLTLSKSTKGLDGIDCSRDIIVFKQICNKKIFLHFIDLINLKNKQSVSWIKVLELVRQEAGHAFSGYSDIVTYVNGKIFIRLGESMNLLHYCNKGTKNLIQNNLLKIHTDDSDNETVELGNDSEDDITDECGIKNKKRLYSEIENLLSDALYNDKCNDESSSIDFEIESESDRDDSADFKVKNSDLKQDNLDFFEKKKNALPIYQPNLSQVLSSFQSLIEKGILLGDYENGDVLTISDNKNEIDNKIDENIILSLKNYNENLEHLSLEKFYCMYIDYERRGGGANQFDSKEPGYRFGMEMGFSFISLTLGIRYDSSFYIWLHDTCVQGVKNENGVLFHLGVTGRGCYGITKHQISSQALEEWENDRLIFVKETAKGKQEEYLSSYEWEEQFSALRIRSNAGRLLVDEEKIQASLKKTIDELFSAYYSGIEKAKTPRKELEEIARLLRALSILHAFSDGNQRTIAFSLLNKLLIEQGFSPAILKDPYCFDGWCSLEEIVEYIVEGMKIFQDPSKL